MSPEALTEKRPSTDPDERARERLSEIGLWSDGVIFNAAEVLDTMRMADICERCESGPPGDSSESNESNESKISPGGRVERCPYRGYKRVLSVLRGQVYSGMTKCHVRHEMESQATLNALLAKMPEEFKTCSLRSFVVDDSVSESVRYAALKTREAITGGFGLILAGDVGVGKTHLAACVFADALLSGRSAVMVSTPQLMIDLKSFGFEGEYKSMLGAVCSCGLLVLDDIGVERCTDWVCEQIYVIVNKRYMDRLQTVVTTNHATPEELVEYFGSGGMRIVSRLIGMGEWVRVTGDDYRVRQRRDRRAKKNKRRPAGEAPA
ncbi:MAG: ATP-binding protein [Synergistaceae bacterium]|jgi:DNA replication protein DnaC|nr:ATP-binding protein [Synergistaceae bacterium]